MKGQREEGEDLQKAKQRKVQDVDQNQIKQERGETKKKKEIFIS